MKSEIRIAAANAAHELVKSLPNLVPVLVAKKEGYALDTGVKDENGKPIYAVIDVTIKNTEATKTAPAFDLDACVQAMQDKMNAPKKEKKTKVADPEAEAKRAAHAARQDALELWCLDNLPTDEGMSTAEIKAALPELLDEVTIMQVGTYLKAIAEKNPIVQRNVVKGKPLYCHA